MKIICSGVQYEPENILIIECVDEEKSAFDELHFFIINEKTNHIETDFWMARKDIVRIGKAYT